MKTLIINFLTLRPTDLSPEILLLAGALWVSAVCVSFSSIASLPMARGWKVLWCLLIIGVPLLGLLLYSLYSLRYVDLQSLRIWGKRESEVVMEEQISNAKAAVIARPSLSGNGAADASKLGELPSKKL